MNLAKPSFSVLKKEQAANTAAQEIKVIEVYNLSLLSTPILNKMKMVVQRNAKANLTGNRQLIICKQKCVNIQE